MRSVFFFLKKRLAAVKQRQCCCCCCCRFSRPHLRLWPHLKFNRQSSKRIIYEQICSSGWLVLCVCVAFRWDRPSESRLLMEPLCQNTKKIRLAGLFLKICMELRQRRGYQNKPHTKYTPSRSRSLISASVVLFVLNKVFMSSHGAVEVTAG